MNNIDITQTLNLNDGEYVNLNDGGVTFGHGAFLISKKADVPAIRDAVVEALNELDIYSEEETKEWPDAVKQDYYTEDQLFTVIDLIADFGIATQELDLTVWFK